MATTDSSPGHVHGRNGLLAGHVQGRNGLPAGVGGMSDPVHDRLSAATYVPGPETEIARMSVDHAQNHIETAQRIKDRAS
jgi:hypothetical protein